MAQQTISHADTFKAGDAKGPLLASDGTRGANIMLPTVEVIAIPVAGAAATISAALATPAAGNLLIDGSGVGGAISGGVWTATAARNLTITSNNAGEVATVSVYGTDINGNLQGEVITFAAAATIVGKKTFKTVTRLALSATALGTISVGTGSILGLKMRSIGLMRSTVENNVVLTATGTFLPGSTTVQTASNDDNRARYTPAAFTAEITVMYFPDLTKEGIGVGMTTRPGPNFVHSDQGNSNGAP